MNPDAAKSATPAGEPADSCVMVIFGASGDLAKRKLIPALFNLARDKLLSQQFAVVGFATRDYTTETFRAHLDEAMEEHAKGSTGEPAWAWLRERLYYVSGSLQDPDAYRRLEAQVGDAAKRAQDREQLFLLPRRSAAVHRRNRAAAGLRGHGTRSERSQWKRLLAPRQHREAVRPRPRLGARAEHRNPENAGRAADLPDRPLPRQGDRAEPDGLPVRQQHLRAHLESQLHRPRADHRRGNAGRRAARRLLRDIGHAARHGAQSPLPAGVADRDGAADLVCRRLGARRADQGAGRHPGSAAGRGADEDGARPIRRGRQSTASACPRTVRSPTWLRTPTPKPSSR